MTELTERLQGKPDQTAADLNRLVGEKRKSFPLKEAALREDKSWVVRIYNPMWAGRATQLASSFNSFTDARRVGDHYEYRFGRRQDAQAFCDSPQLSNAIVGPATTIMPPTPSTRSYPESINEQEGDHAQAMAVYNAALALQGFMDGPVKIAIKDTLPAARLDQAMADAKEGVLYPDPVHPDDVAALGIRIKPAVQDAINKSISKAVKGGKVEVDELNLELEDLSFMEFPDAEEYGIILAGTFVVHPVNEGDEIAYGEVTIEGAYKLFDEQVVFNTMTVFITEVNEDALTPPEYVQEELLKQNCIKSSYKTYSLKGDRAENVQGWIPKKYNNFGMTFEQGTKSGWSITHLRTGMNMGWGIPLAEDALKFIGEIDKMADWSQGSFGTADIGLDVSKMRDLGRKTLSALKKYRKK